MTAGIRDELLEAARIDGTSEMQTFLRVVLPLCMIALFLLFQRSFVQGFARSGIR